MTTFATANSRYANSELCKIGHQVRTLHFGNALAKALFKAVVTRGIPLRSQRQCFYGVLKVIIVLQLL